MVECDGPLAFHHMIQLILSVEDQAISSLVRKIQEMRLKDFPGENVSTAASYLRGVILLLENCKEIPTDLMGLLNEIFTSASTADFSAYVNMLYTSHHTSVKIMTLLQFIEDAEKEYRLYYRCEKWTAAKHDPGSVFYAGSKDICYNCGEEGHSSYECSKPSTRYQFAPFGWKPGGGRGHNGGRGDAGRGRYGRNRGRGRGGQRSFPRSGKKNKLPPKPGENHKRKKEGSNK